MEKVDVIINVYGKPFQTICTLKSLMEHCESHIDKIYFINEKIPPFNDDALWVTKHFSNVIAYMPPVNHHFEPRKEKEYYNDETHRFCLKYQYGIEKSDKKYVFITHNDSFYTGDIIGEMLGQIGDAVGIGLIGQCWNCPTEGKCDPNSLGKYSPTYDEVIELIKTHASPRTTEENINKTQPIPLPECRLNEFACIINREITLKESWPNGNSPLFGSLNGVNGVDMGCEWFRSMFLKGYKFKNYEIYQTSQHGYFSPINSGCMVQNNESFYWTSEAVAQEYFLKTYNE